MLVAISALALGAIQPALVLPVADEAWPVHLLFILVFWVYVAAGLMAWSRRPGNRPGSLIVVPRPSSPAARKPPR